MGWRAALALTLMACGGAVQQSADCQKWIACSDALPGSIRGSQDDAYGADGGCWKATPQVAEQCTSACRDATGSHAMTPNAPEACR